MPTPEDILAAVPNEIQKYACEVAEFVNGSVDQVAGVIREVLATAEWVPEQFRPPPPPPPAIITVPVGALERFQNWIGRHKILTAFVLLTTGTVAYKTYQTSVSIRKKRRARRSRTGGRVEVVVVAGSPALPLTRSLALDLERKGFIVFVVCNTHDEELMVQNLSRPDIRPLGIDITDPPSAGSSIDHFARYLQSPHCAIPKGEKYHIRLKAVILIPSLNYTTSPIATIPPSSFADLFNTHLLHPIVTIQAFLPLLTTRLATAEKKEITETPETRKDKSPKVLVFTPSIIPSINPPFHAPEATVCSALSAFTEVLAAELGPLQIPVTHMQLGTFDFSGFTPAQQRVQRGQNWSGGRQQQLLLAEEAETLNWPEMARRTYARNFVNQSTSAIAPGKIGGIRGSSLKELHNAVFDVIDGSLTSGTVRVGLGASVYGFVGRWVPRTVVAYMMGIRKVDELAAWQSSAHGTPRSGSNNGGDEDDQKTTISGSESFITVPGASDHHSYTGSNVWK
ncbi:hypothetical protein QBC38DRAFT_443937 [Podospora fimiseda]|uniref:DUF1776-domain-containing protein n=1 Tax=Podospora fimiseda TaxID=252190 RepID=A0AAN7H4F7_9PEZI|nr:hypothetical protein QBC38DRAFT_443937 [Podospora fimiseda]